MVLSYMAQPFLRAPFEVKVDFSKVKVLKWKITHGLLYLNYKATYNNGSGSMFTDNSIYIQQKNINNYEEAVLYLEENHIDKQKLK